MTVAAITKITNKVAMCSYLHEIILYATMVEYKLEVAHSIANINLVVIIIEVAIIPRQTKIAAIIIDP